MHWLFLTHARCTCPHCNTWTCPLRCDVFCFESHCTWNGQTDRAMKRDHLFLSSDRCQESESELFFHWRLTQMDIFSPLGQNSVPFIHVHFIHSLRDLLCQEAMPAKLMMKANNSQSCVSYPEHFCVSLLKSLGTWALYETEATSRNTFLTFCTWPVIPERYTISSFRLWPNSHWRSDPSAAGTRLLEKGTLSSIL